MEAAGLGIKMEIYATALNGRALGAWPPSLRRHVMKWKPHKSGHFSILMSRYYIVYMVALQYES